MKTFVLLCALNLFAQWVISWTLVTDELISDFLGFDVNLINNGRIDWSWLSYLILIGFIAVRVTLVSLSLSTGGLIIGKSHGLSLWFGVAIKADFILVIPYFIKIFWFTFQDNFSLKEVTNFFPLSLFSLWDSQEIENWLVYPLQLANLFELAYFFFLAWELRSPLNRDFLKSLLFVASTYGLGLIVWVVLVMFIAVTLT